MKSWKTTVTGVAAILTAVGAALTALFDNDPNTTLDVVRTLVERWRAVGPTDPDSVACRLWGKPFGGCDERTRMDARRLFRLGTGRDSGT